MQCFVRLRFGPRAPGMALERLRPIRRKEFDQLMPLLVGEARADTDMLQVASVVVQAEEERSDGRASGVFVPAKSSDDTVAVSFVLHLEHDALIRFVDALFGFRDDAVEP